MRVTYTATATGGRADVGSTSGPRTDGASAKDMRSDEAIELPRPFGDYTLLKLLGRGGMGDVFLATKRGIAGISRRCVVKTLRAGFGADSEYVGRFLDEARIVVQLHHKNICPVFEVGESERSEERRVGKE